MDFQDFLLQAFIYLSAAVLSVPIAQRLGLGSVLGYLVAGIAIGPFVFGFVGAESGIMHFAEFGVVMMLFIIGLELRPALLWAMRKPILGLGGLQVLITGLAIAGIAYAVGMDWPVAVAIGMVLALSSTAIVLQSLREKGLMGTEGGQSAFAVLLFQDIAVIPMLAVLPLLALDSAIVSDATGHGVAVSGWRQAILVVGVVAGIILVGRFVMRPVFRFIAETRLRDIFTATALLLVIGIALLMHLVGLSPALGAFLAGVVLAESEYRHELESNIEPFKALLLGLFFISVGASIDFALILDRPLLIVGMMVGLIALKLVIMIGLARIFRLATSEGLLFAFALAQGGEFAFVLLSFAIQSHVLTPEIANPLVAVVALSMAVTPVLLVLHERLIAPMLAQAEVEQEADEIDSGDKPVVIAGFGRFGMTVGRLLAANGVQATILDHDVRQIEALRKFGFTVFYGDASRLDLLTAAGCDNAKLLVIAVDDPDKAIEIADVARQNFPNLRILARVRDRRHGYEFLERGIEDIFRETHGSAVAMGAAVLTGLGYRKYKAHRAARAFRHHDEHTFHELAPMWQDESTYIIESQQRAEDIRRLLQADKTEDYSEVDHAWEAPPSR
jgi:monovalent cation:proton antiporter-2 (CPA2) family protein